MFKIPTENIFEKVTSLERQLTATQLKLSNVCNWIQLKFGEDPSKLCGEESRLSKNVEGAVYKVHQFSSALDPAPIVPNSETAETAIKIEEGDTIISTIYNLAEDSQQDNEHTTSSEIRQTKSSASKTASSSSTATTMKERKVAPPNVTAFTLYSSHVRERVKAENPDKTFGEISQIIGTQWSKMTTNFRNIYQIKAMELNRKTQLIGNRAPSSNKTDLSNEDLLKRTIELKISPDWIFRCLWDGCDLEFEDAYDLVVHCANEPGGHVCLTFANWPFQHFANIFLEGEFQCKWRRCPRVPRGEPPFTKLNHLLNHVREYHILNGNGREVPSHKRSKNTLPSGRELFKPLSKTRKRKIATCPGMHPAKFIPINEKFSPMEIETEVGFAAFEEESDGLSDPLQLAAESTVKQEREFGLKTEEPHDYSAAQGQEATVSEIYLVDMTHLIPTSEFLPTNTLDTIL